MLFPAAHQNSFARVVVTGVGIVTAYGIGWKKNAEGFRAGRPAFGPVTLFDVSRQRVKVAAQAVLPEENPPRVKPSKARRFERAARLLFYAADDAWRAARWDSSRPTALVLGTTSGGMSRGEEYFREAVRRPDSSRWQATRVTHYLAQRQALDLAEAFQLSGPVTMIANACATGANAIGHAFELVRSGRVERALAGGYDALSQLVFAGFDSLQALSPTACRPFDAERDGLSLGEGAAVLAIEPFEPARERGAEILGEIAGYGAATDIHHLTQPHPNGTAALEAMKRACQCAGIAPSQVGYINAHGTGTPLNDAAEAEAINAWAGPHGPNLWVSSTKAGIGHLLGAAGAVEAAACLMAQKEQWLPPMPATGRADPLVRFRLVRRATAAIEWPDRFEYTLSNSFGFGGANAALLFRRAA